MFCPKCELEIKGDNKKVCPICESELVDSPFDVSLTGDGEAEDDVKLRELISDIEEKVTMNLDQGEEKEMPPNADAGPPADAFLLHDGDDAEAPSFDRDMPPDLSDLGDELDSIIAGLKAAEDSRAPAEEHHERSLQQESDELTQQLAEIGAQPVSEEPAAPALNVDADEDLTTREILDQALEELEGGPPPPPVQSRRALPALIMVLLAVVIAGGAYYYFGEKSGMHTAPAVRPAPEPALRAEAVPADPAVALQPAAEMPAAAIAKTVEAAADIPAPASDDAAEDLASPATAPEEVRAAPAPPAESPPAPAAIAAEKPAGRYSIHAGSYPTPAVADAEVRRLAALGFDTRSSRVDLGDRGIWYRVMIGNFDTREQAQEVQARLKARDSVPSRIVRRN